MRVINLIRRRKVVAIPFNVIVGLTLLFCVVVSSNKCCCFGFTTSTPTKNPICVSFRPIGNIEYSKIPSTNYQIAALYNSVHDNDNESNTDDDETSSPLSPPPSQPSQSTSTSTEPSPWKSSKWRFILNIGREAGTYMPEEWGASGGRLVLSVDVEITSDRISKAVDTNKEGVDDPMLKHNPFAIKLLDTTSKYITNQGEQICEFKKVGGWKIRFPLIDEGQDRGGGRAGGKKKITGHASTLRCYIDLVSNVKRNDVTLNGKERIYFTGKCWREEDVEYAYTRMKPIEDRYNRAQERLDEALSHEYGDRRLDGTDLMDTLAGMKDTAQLVIERDGALRQLEEANRIYPTIPLQELPEGPWPGQIEWLSIEPRKLLVRREQFLVGDEYHIIGTWTATPLFDENDDDYEYDEDDKLSIF